MHRLPFVDVQVHSRRRWQGFVSVFTIIPIWFAAVRIGFGQQIPVGDTAIMALRAPDMVHWPPALIGMPGSSASSATHVVHFPAAWQLWWLALPVKTLGPTWGTVIAMGFLNSIWILGALWLIFRNFNINQALLASVFVGAFCWSIGATNLVDSWPLHMVLAPFMALCFAAPCAANGDRVALWFVAVVANYLWLDHFVLAVLAPAVALAGVIGFVAWSLRRIRSSQSERPIHQRALIRSLSIAGAITVFLWIPALVQQGTGSPGNLGLLFSHRGDAPRAIGSWTSAGHVVISLIARPPFWLRGTLNNPTFYRSHYTSYALGSLTWFDVGAAIALILIVTWLTILSWRRRDRVCLSALACACAAIVGSLVTVAAAPITAAVVPEYFHSIWAVAVLSWFAIALNLIRSVRWRDTTALRGIGVLLVVVFSVANLPDAHTGYRASPDDNTVAKAMINALIPKLENRGPVAVSMENTLTGNANYLSALLVALKRHDIAYCFPPPNTSLYAFIPTCSGNEGTKIVLSERTQNNPPEGKVLFAAHTTVTRPHPDPALDHKVRSWLAHIDSLQLTHEIQHPFLGPLVTQLARSQLSGFTPQDGNLAHLANDPAFWRVITMLTTRGPDQGVPLFAGSPLSGSQLYAWAVGQRSRQLMLWVVEPATPQQGSSQS